MITGRAAADGSPTQFKVFDTDVHHGPWETASLFPYLSAVHADRLKNYGFGGGGVGWAYNGGSQGYRADILTDRSKKTYPGVVVPDPTVCKTELLDEAGVDLALLVGGGGEGIATAGPDVAYTNALLRAFNDYSVAEWLTVDDRFRLAIAVNPQDPQAAAEEIDRLGAHSQVLSVILPCGATKPYGHPYFRPLHEACVRNNLAITLHFGAEGSGVNPQPSSAGYPTSYVQSRLLRPAFYKPHLASFVFDGVFEEFPSLKVGMIETGITWVPSFVWLMDQNWKALRPQVPWVKRPPSEYVRSNVKFCSQPLDDPEPKDGLAKTLEWMDGDNTVMFSSDYPHFDWDEPRETFKTSSDESRRRLLWDNAAELYGVA